MIAVDYDDTNILNILFDYFHFFDCSKQTSISSVRNAIFWFCKKYFEADAVLNMIKKIKKRQVTGFGPLCHKFVSNSTFRENIPVILSDDLFSSLVKTQETNFPKKTFRPMFHLTKISNNVF